MAQFIEFVGNHPILSFGWLFLVGALLLDFYRSALSPVKSLKPNQVTLLVNREEAQLLDIRSDAEFRKGHIAGARHISAQAIEKGDLAGLESDKQTPMIVVCSSGVTAGKAARQLAQAGFEKVSLLQGGMQAWTNDNLPVITGNK